MQKISAINIVVLISGRGSNLQSIIDQAQSGELDVNLCAVISNDPTAYGLKRANTAGIPTEVIDSKQCASKEAFEELLRSAIDQFKPQLVVLAGFMKVLSSGFVDHYRGRMINIHPSLLPAFPGLNTHQRALQAKSRFHGASVHFVTQEVDGGPIIIQARVPVHADDDPDSLAARVLEQEHRIYPLAIQWFAQNRLKIEGNRVLLDNGIQTEQGFSEPD